MSTALVAVGVALVAVEVALVAAAGEAHAAALRPASRCHAPHAAITGVGVGVRLVGLTAIIRVVARLVRWARPRDRRVTLSAISVLSNVALAVLAGALTGEV